MYVNAVLARNIKTVGLLNNRPFRPAYVDSADLFFVKRLFSLGGSKCIVELYWDCKSSPL